MFESSSSSDDDKKSVCLLDHTQSIFLACLRVGLVPTIIQMWMAFGRQLRDFADATVYFGPTSFLVTELKAYCQ